LYNEEKGRNQSYLLNDGYCSDCRSNSQVKYKVTIAKKPNENDEFIDMNVIRNKRHTNEHFLANNSNSSISIKGHKQEYLKNISQISCYYDEESTFLDITNKFCNDMDHLVLELIYQEIAKTEFFKMNGDSVINRLQKTKLYYY